MSKKNEYMLYTMSVNNINIYGDDYEGTKKIDLNDDLIFSEVILTCESHQDTAFFYQFREILKAWEVDTYCFMTRLAVLDFTWVDKKNQNRFIEKGIYIIQKDEKDPVHFVASEKSSSMAKKDRMLFIDENYLVRMRERIMLGMNAEILRGIQTNLSKLYSYKGLYLSDADRIYCRYQDADKKVDDVDKNIFLDNRTIIVIDDGLWNTKSKAEILTAKESGKDEDGKAKYELEKAEKRIILNAFDGEGMVCQQYAEEINEQIGAKGATSFQIRMPFVKGMLHQVDWHKIISDAGINADDMGKIYVTDIFGKERKLSDVRIVLTKSMFKCHKWFKRYCEKAEIDDPMKFYFDQIKEYKHSLYISQNNTTHIKNGTKTELTYQFLNTMALDDGTIKSLIDNHNNIIKAMDTNPVETMNLISSPPATDDNYEPGPDTAQAQEDTISANNQASDEDNTAENQIQEELNATEDWHSVSKKAWKSALEYNNDFAAYEYVKGKLENYKKTLIMDVADGRIVVDGTVRYLSGDLLALVRHMVDQCAVKDSNTDIKKTFNEFVKGNLLGENRFYLPDSPKISKKKPVVLLRNPHLSRNEEVWLYPKKKILKGEKDFYEMYFSHLKGIVMVAQKSLAPMALSGADFDGDIVRVIWDKIVVAAVRKGMEDKKKVVRDGTKGNESKPKLPYITIPSPAGIENTICDSVDAKVIMDSFSSKVGIISNKAIRFGEIEYGGGSDELMGVTGGNSGLKKIEPEESLCAECCILVGLELDACKNGIHPNLDNITEKDKERKEYLQNLKNYKEKNPDETDYIAYSKKIKKANIYRGELKVNSDNKDQPKEYSLKIGNYAFKISAADKGKLEQMPTLFCKSYIDNNGGKIPTANREKKMFWFDGMKNDVFNQTLLEEVESIVDAYKYAKTQADVFYKKKNKFSDAGYFSKVVAILNDQYGDPKKEKIPGEEITVWDACNKARKAVEEYTGNDIDNAKKLLESIIKDWCFTEKSERETKLKELLGDTNIDDSAVELLTNFDNRGYEILYYIAKQIYWGIKTNKEIEYGATDDSLLEKKKQDYCEKVNDYLSKKSDKGYIDKQLLMACRDNICEAFKGKDVNDCFGEMLKDTPAIQKIYAETPENKKKILAMAYIFKTDETCFWDMFDWEDIKLNLIK